MAGMQHDFSSGTPSGATVGATSTEVVSARSDRAYVALINDSDETIYVSLGSAAVINAGFRLNRNGGAMEIAGDRLFRGAIYAICASGGKNLAIFEA